MPEKKYFSYNQIHNLVKSVAEKITSSGDHYDLILAIGGGGFIPARILRTYIKKPILAVGLMLYTPEDKPTDKPSVVQWLDEQNLQSVKNKNVLIVDEVDDTRATLEHCVQKLNAEGVNQIGIMIIHNKKKEKKGKLSEDILKHYYAASEIEDQWVVYPWDASSIEDHDANVKN
eukprot:TRINITY_DN2512_c0_g1_i1.p1 TRINITY_DN2512_c0_g1~~TRINITY_DN2512_c0_g1_i1.p1  ORF type:complete len:174 (-),score=57.31 TRINITY_DN2512_c0_g1_i1:34-555(-)